MRAAGFGLAPGVVLYDGGRAGAAAAAKAKHAAGNAAVKGPKLSLNALLSKPKPGSGGAATGAAEACPGAAQVLLIQPSGGGGGVDGATGDTGAFPYNR